MIATSDLRPHHNSYDSDLKEALLKLTAIFSIALSVIYKLEINY